MIRDLCLLSNVGLGFVWQVLGDLDRWVSAL
jgi:hypothetical protein